MSESVDYERYNPFDPKMQQDPFPWYAALRAHAPVWKHPGTGIVFVSRHGPVSQILADTATYASRVASLPTFGSSEGEPAHRGDHGRRLPARVDHADRGYRRRRERATAEYLGRQGAVDASCISIGA